MSKNGLNKKGKSAHSEELRFTLDSAGRGTAAELLRRLKPYRFKFALSLGLSLVYVFLTLLIPVLAGKIIDCIIGAGRVDFAEISPFLLKLGAAAAGAALSQWLVSLCNNSITYGCVRNIRAEAFRRIQKLPLAYFDSHPAGETVSRMLSDADQLADGLFPIIHGDYDHYRHTRVHAHRQPADNPCCCCRDAALACGRKLYFQANLLHVPQTKRDPRGANCADR